MTHSTSISSPTWSQVQAWARELGFSQIGLSDLDLQNAETGLLAWLEAQYHGTMHYMSTHGTKRARPADLLPGTVAVLTARMNYLPPDTPADWQRIEWAHLSDQRSAVISQYARGRDYHKVLRQRLQTLADRINAAPHLVEGEGPIAARVFTDSAPVMEVELAHKSSLGWRGKHTLLLSRDAGSMFFLGEIFLFRSWPVNTAPARTGVSTLSAPSTTSHCGHCTACIDACPTQAIVAPYRLDARLCISYQTIENHEEIPEALRPLMGQRIYGCDDCQLACPWNKFAQNSCVPDFKVRPDWRPSVDNWERLFAWDEQAFLDHTQGSPIRRIGHTRWLRNLAVAMGNMLRHATQAGDTPQQAKLRTSLQSRLHHDQAIVRSHVQWALQQGQINNPARGYTP